MQRGLPQLLRVTVVLLSTVAVLHKGTRRALCAMPTAWLYWHVRVGVPAFAAGRCEWHRDRIW